MNRAALLALTACLGFGQPPQVEIGSVEIEGQLVNYVAQDGYAIVQGDIIWGALKDLPAPGKASRLRPVNIAPVALWPDGVIPYTIDPDVPNPQRILDGVNFWNTLTPLRVVPRTSESNYVRFRRVTGDFSCTAALGMRGGEQLVQVTDVCSVGAVAHEMGHAFGLNHEQERNDRNAYVSILYNNIDKRFIYAFDQGTGTRDSGYYDYDSILHYSTSGFTRTGLSSIESIPPGIPMGQRTTLSAADIDQASRLYGFTPATTTVTTIPAGLPIVVDGTSYTSPRTFNWTFGSAHTVSVNAQEGADPRYNLVRWTDGGAATHSFTASPDQTVVAAVFQVQHRLTVNVAAGNGSAAIRPLHADGYYVDRTTVQMDATPGAGSAFLRWTGTGNPHAIGFGMSAPRMTGDVMTVNGSFSANFTTAPTTTVTSNPPGRQITVDGFLYVTPATFAFAPGSSHALSLVPTQMAGNNTTRYRFTSWEDGPTGSSRSITAGTSVSANFTTEYLLATVITGTGTLTATPSSPDGFYLAGTSVQLNALGTVRMWLGDTAGAGNSKTVVMSEQRYVNPVFASVLPYRPVSAASYLGHPIAQSFTTAVAPLEIVTVFGTDVGPPVLTSGVLDSNGRLSTQVAGTRILFDTAPAPIIYAFATQTSVVVPAAVAQKATAGVLVERNGVVQPGAYAVQVVASKPALFTASASGTGNVAAINEDGTINSRENPAKLGKVVILFAGGAGLMDRPLIDGEIMGSDLARPQGRVNVSFGKLPGEILYAGTAPFLVNGALQVNVRVPVDSLAGEIPVHLSVGPWSSPPGVTIWVE